MNSIRDLLKLGMPPSKAFKRLIEQGQVRTNSELADLLYSELGGLSPPVMLTISNWNRRENSEPLGTGLSDERLDEILFDLMGECLSGEGRVPEE